MFPDLLQAVSAVLLSTAIGGISAILGLGGGFLLVPSLTQIYGLDIKTAIGTSLSVTIFTALAAGTVYHSRKTLCWKTALVAAGTGVLGSVTGAILTGYLPARLLTVLFSILLLVLAVQMILPKIPLLPRIRFGPSFREECSDGVECPWPLRIYYLPVLVWGFLGGLVSGITGLSAGTVMVPALVTVGLPLQSAVGTSFGLIIAISTAGAITHLSLGNYSAGYLIICAAGVIPGAYIGARLASRIPARVIHLVFGLLVAGIAVFLLL